VIAALFVQPRGIYTNIPGVDPWPEDRDARQYAGPDPVVAHPPCGPWGRYAKRTPDSRALGPMLGDDDGCFASALASVRRWGGVLEHPTASKAWERFSLPVPRSGGGWSQSLLDGGWVCEVEQGHYGHPAQKPTWLYYSGDTAPEPLIWGPSTVEGRPWAKARGVLECLSKNQRAATPRAFADALAALARGARSDHPCEMLDPYSDCPECQLRWGEMVDSMSQVGANVRVSLPGDIAPWHAPAKIGASWIGDVVGVNGDTLDIINAGSDVEPVPIEYCRPWKPGTFQAWSDL
jgi:hypothetical protein